MKSYLLGLDVGTGGTRAVLVGKDGAMTGGTLQRALFASPSLKLRLVIRTSPA